MKNLIKCLLLVLAIGCKKQPQGPVNTPSTANQHVQAFPDTSLSGTYQMFYSSVATELDNTIIFTCRFDSYQYNLAVDSTHPYVVYRLHDKRFSATTIGDFWVSKNAEYQSGLLPKADPFVTAYRGGVSTGFIQCQQVSYTNNGTFVHDTLILPLSISPTNPSIGPPPYQETVKYKRIGN